MKKVLASLADPLIALFVLVFFVTLGTGMVWSIIAVYAGSLGASVVMVGFMISSFGGARILVNFPSGFASEKFGRRQMMRLGCIMTVISSFTAVFAAGITPLFICLVLLGIGSAVFVTSALAAVVDLGTPGRRMQDMSAYQAATIIGISLGPGLGGMAAGQWGYAAPFAFQGGIAAVALVALAFIPWRNASAVSADEAAKQAVSVKGILRQAIGVGLMAFGIFYVRVASNWILLPLLAQSKFGMSVDLIGLALTCGALANLACLPFMSWGATHIGRTGLIVISSVVTITGAFVLAYPQSEIFIWLASICFGVGAGIASPTLTAFVADVAAPHQRGPAMGLLRTMQDASIILGPVVTGFLSDRLDLGFRGGLFGCILIWTVATVVFLWTARSR